MSDNEQLQPIGKRIVIHHTHNRKGNTGGMLEGCFFLPTELKDFFNFHDQRGEILATGVSSDRPFPILLGDLAWTINMGKIDDLLAHGDWKNNGPNFADEQDGSFQASSSGGVEPDAINETAPDAPVGAIEIKTVSGGSDKDKLKGCYFMVSGTTWSLYNKSGNLLQSGQTSATGFTFNHDSNKPNGTKITWTVTNFVISDTAASGTWTNPDDPTITGEQTGTFQASSSGGLGEDHAAAGASA